jgi:hypothetical protein
VRLPQTARALAGPGPDSRRELLLDVVRELKELAAQAEVAVPGSGYFDPRALAAREQRLRVALAFFPPTELPLTRAAADPHDLTQDVARAAIAPATAELMAEMEHLQGGVYGLSADSAKR